MLIRPFELERYFAKYEFSAKYLLSSSDCDGLSQSEVLSWADEETRQLWDQLKLGYTESRGLPLLRKEVAKFYQNIFSEEVLISVPEEGIFLALNSILEKGDHVICTWPGYQSLYELANSIGCDVERWEPNENDHWKFNIQILKNKIRSNSKLLVINFPHNPTGSLPSATEFQEIIKIAKEHHLYIFSDEMYRFLEFRPQDRLLSACEVYDKAVSLFGLSKTFGMAGVRIGWVITRDKALYKKMMELKDYTTICSSAPSEILSLIALRAKDKIITRHLATINQNLSLLGGFFNKYKHLFSWVRPMAGTIAFPKILFDDGSLRFCERVVDETGIMLLPSTVYGYGDQHFRLGFGRKNMPIVLQEFEKYLDRTFLT